MKNLFLKFLLILITITFSGIPLESEAASGVRLRNHMPLLAMAKANHLGRLPGGAQIALTVALGLRNQAGLMALISRLYNPQDPLYGQYLTPDQFAQMYGPSAQDMTSVAQYMNDNGLTVVGRTTNTIQLKGAVSDIEKAFALELHEYQTVDARLAFAPNANPQVESSIAPKIAGILGLNSFSNLVAHRHRRPNAAGPQPIGTGPDGGLSPSDIQKAYSFSTGSSDGAGQTLALMELDGYTPSDITGYAQQFGMKSTPSLQNILISGSDGSAGDGADEVTLDIELMMAVAPGASKILVYEGPNSETGPLDVYTKIADDNLAKQVSTSWGSPESQNTAAFMNSENTVFMQMAAQGQSIYAAAGDSGAYDDGTNLSVDDPASQPYVVATGGTTLAITSSGAYQSESSWGIPATKTEPEQGGGGGISSVWPLPSWQAGIASATNKGSTVNRMVPDISMNANPNTGYAIFVGGSWNIYGGTSCAAPLWAAFTALVNQQRAASGLSTLGFPNPALYKLAGSTSYLSLFNDILDKSTNLFYPAVSGYDLSTGWGSMKSTNLITALAAGTNPVPTPTPTPTPAPSSLAAPVNVTAVPHNQIATITWSAVNGAQSYTVSRASSSSGPFSQVGSPMMGTSYTDIHLTNGQTYFYEVTAVNSSSQSKPSSVVSVMPSAMPPEAPTNLSVVSPAGN